MQQKRPVVMVIMDGIGINNDDFGNAVKSAYMPTLEHLLETCPNIQIQAHGTAVGLPSDDDMGNSEVGHNALGCGQIYAQAQSWLTSPSRPVGCLPRRRGKPSSQTVWSITPRCTSSVCSPMATSIRILPTSRQC